MHVYKHLATFGWSVRVTIYLIITFRYLPQMHVYKLSGTIFDGMLSVNIAPLGVALGAQTATKSRYYT